MSFEEIAIIGISCRVPGAENTKEFWENLLAKKEDISRFTPDELLDSGCTEEDINSHNYIPVKGFLKDADCFDHEFFNILPHIAKWLDPQQRVFLEACYHSLEDAGYIQNTHQQSIGVFAGASFNTYLTEHLRKHPELFEGVDWHQLVVNSSVDFLSTRVSHALDLEGPSQTIQTACSSSLVAIHHACTSLLTYQCDIALAGGVSIMAPLKSGYHCKENSVFSPTGKCRPFDKEADGIVPGNGVGVVTLKRLSNALSDKDHIYAVISGSAINNDGRNKMSFAAPTVKGQASVIQAAAEFAGINPNQLTWIETHGTGTKLGDRIELNALRNVLTDTQNPKCALTSTKANIGHLDVAAGVIGLIRGALALHHGVIAPSTNFNMLHDKEWKDEPFFVATNELRIENPPETYIGVSSFGIGGTNAHAVLRGAPKHLSSATTAEQYHILPLSAKNPTALSLMTDQYKNHLRTAYCADISAIAYTLQKHRPSYRYRTYLVSANDGTILNNDLLDEPLAKRLGAWISGAIEATEIQDLNPCTKAAFLPSYAFEKKRCWLSEDAQKTTRLHLSNPLVHTTQNLRIDFEKELSLLLCKEFGLQNPSVSDSFEDLGIDSFSSIDLLCQIEKQFGFELSYEELVKHNSIVELASYCSIIKSNQSNVTTMVSSAKESLCVLLRQGSSNLPPLFAIHPAGGSVAIFKDICSSLDTHRKVYGIQAISNIAAALARNSIPEMAKAYLAVIKEKQATGPYYLCGSSMGGAIAYQIATLLEHKGDKVELLVMLDTPSPFHPSYVPESDEAVLNAIKEFSPTIYDQLIDGLQKNNTQTQDFIKLWRSHHDSVFSFIPAPYEGKILYFYAAERDRFTRDNLHEGWADLTKPKGKFECHIVPGNHISMHLNPHASTVAHVISEAMGYHTEQMIAEAG